MNPREQEPQKQSPPSQVAKIPKEDVARGVQQGRSDFVLLDARDRAEYELGHVPGARSMPLDEADAMVAGLDRSKQYVTYCGSST
jgi:rhodanese-related sulfurtransferase